MPIDGDVPTAPRGGRPSWGDTSPQGFLQAIARRWWVVVLCVLVLAAGAVAVGSARKPTYSASSSLNVGQVDVRVQALSSFVTGASSLAASYSRIATSQPIVDSVAQDVGTTPADVSARLRATSVPSSPIFQITGTGKSERDAIRLTNAAVKRMRAYVARRSADNASATRLLKAYSAQARTTADLQRRYERLKARRARGLATTTDPTGATTTGKTPSASAVTAAQVEFQTADLQSQALSGQYQAQSADSAGSAGVELLNRAFSASSDKSKKLQQLLAGAIVAGLVIGCGLALLLDRRRRPAARAA